MKGLAGRGQEGERGQRASRRAGEWGDGLGCTAFPARVQQATPGKQMQDVCETAPSPVNEVPVLGVPDVDAAVSGGRVDVAFAPPPHRSDGRRVAAHGEEAAPGMGWGGGAQARSGPGIGRPK